MLGEDVTAALPLLQTEALSIMTDRCVIRDADAWVDEQKVEGAVAWQYAGVDAIPCRIKAANTEPQDTAVGGQQILRVRIQVSLPIEICPTRDQVITVTSAADPALPGRRFVVVAANVGSQITARRVQCVEHR